MLRWISLAVLVVALVAGATFLSLNATIAEPTTAPAPPVITGPAPKMEFNEPLIYEFGSMAQLSAGNHTWEIKNVGDADLEIGLKRTTCSCTSTRLKAPDGEEKKTLVIKPKESTKIPVEWNTKTFRDDYSQGITLGTNDPAKPEVSLNVHGKVYPPVILVPNDVVRFESVSNEETHSTNIAVFSMDRPTTKVTKVTTSRPEFLVAKPEALTAEDCKQLKCKGGYKILVELKPGMPLGQFNEELVIETDHPLRSELKMAITGNAVGPISVIPARLRMTSVSSSQGAVSEMTLLVRGGKPTKIEVAYHPEKLAVKITPEAQPGRYKMTVTVPPGTAAGPVDGDIILKTDHPNAREMKVPVRVLISNVGAG